MVAADFRKKTHGGRDVFQISKDHYRHKLRETKSDTADHEPDHFYCAYLRLI